MAEKVFFIVEEVKFEIFDTSFLCLSVVSEPDILHDGEGGGG